MFDIDKWQEIFQTIRKNKLRTFLTALSVFWGIFMLVFMMGAGKGLENGAKQGFASIATNSCFVWGWKTAIPYKGLSPGRYVRFTNEDIKAISDNINEIKYIAPRARLDGDVSIKFENKSVVANVQGDVTEIKYILPLDLVSGRFLNEPDMKEKRKIAIISVKTADDLFLKDVDPIGKNIDIQGVFFTVAGVFKSRQTGERADEDEKNIYIPLPTLQKAFNKGNRINYFSFLAKEGVKVSVAEEKIKVLLAERQKVSPDDKEAIRSNNVEQEFNKFQGIFIGINGLIWFVGICTIIAGVVSVSNIMLIIVKERTREIGIRKAIGATPFSIISLILQESIVITAFSGYMGLITGIGLVELIRVLLEKFNIDNPYFKSPQIDLDVAVSATLLLIVAGALAGLIPASKAARIKPIEALKEE